MDEVLTWESKSAKQLAGLYGVDADVVRNLYKRMKASQEEFPRNSTQLAEDTINDFEDNGVPLGLGTDYDTDLIYDLALYVA